MVWMRRHLATFALAAAMALPVARAVVAAEPQIPVLFDASERLPKPDVSGIERLRFLTATDFPPFNFLDTGGRLSGFHIDLARAICAELALTDKCQLQALPWDRLEGALKDKAGEAIVAGISVTPEAREKLAFSRPYFVFPARFVTQKRAAATEPIVDQLQDKQVGVMAGSGHERMLRTYFPGLKVVPYDQQNALFEDLKANKIAAIFGDGMRMSFWLGGSDSAGCCRFAGGPYLAPEFLGQGLAIAVRAEDSELVTAFDYALHELSVKGKLAELYLRYFPISFF